MKKLLVYIKEYKKECILGPLFKLLEACFDLIVPLVMAKMIDEGVLGDNNSIIIKMGIILFVLALVGLTCSITAQYFAAKAAIGFVSNIRESLFKHIQKLSVSQINSLGSSTLLTRMTSDINQLQSGTNMALRLFLRSPFIVAGAVILSYTISIKEGFLFSGMIVLLAIVIFSIMLITMPLYKKIQSSLDEVTLNSEENLSGIRVIRAFNRQDDEIEKFVGNNDKLSRLQIHTGRISSLMNPLTYLILNLTLVLVIWVAAKQLNIGLLHAGAIIALINYMTQILTELIKLADTIILSTKAISCGERIQAVFDVVPEFYPEDEDNKVKASNGDFDYKEPLVEFNDVTFKYKSAKEPSLENINLKLYKGQTIGVIGSTGSGKSTLVNLIPRFYDATDGEIIYKNKNVKEYDISELRKLMSPVLQKSVLLSGTIRENLCVSKPDATEDDIIYALKASQSYDFVMQKQNGIDYKISEGAKNLSGGQKQRIAIARGLIKEPEILIFDDSFSALDFKTDLSVRRAIKELTFDPLTIIVSQRVSTVSDCDEILVMDDGQIVGRGKHEELLKNCEVYKSIYESQIKMQ
ncbi:MAG: ABC transporter ATP-binding protein/permease [Lachnospiraceae bacterium]|nr:ABC transporter ATP-binding protein/permease [Lachnospiraceae bacterium]